MKGCVTDSIDNASNSVKNTTAFYELAKIMMDQTVTFKSTFSEVHQWDIHLEVVEGGEVFRLNPDIPYKSTDVQKPARAVEALFKKLKALYINELMVRVDRSGVGAEGSWPYRYLGSSGKKSKSLWLHAPAVMWQLYKTDLQTRNTELMQNDLNDSYLEGKSKAFTPDSGAGSFASTEVASSGSVSLSFSAEATASNSSNVTSSTVNDFSQRKGVNQPHTVPIKIVKASGLQGIAQGHCHTIKLKLSCVICLLCYSCTRNQ